MRSSATGVAPVEVDGRTTSATVRGVVCGTLATFSVEAVADGDAPELVVVPVTDPGRGRRPVVGAPVSLAWDDVRDARVQVDLAAVREADEEAGPQDGAGRG